MLKTPVTKTKTFKIFFRTVSDSNWLDLPGLCNSKNSAKIPIQNKLRNSRIQKTVEIQHFKRMM